MKKIIFAFFLISTLFGENSRYIVIKDFGKIVKIKKPVKRCVVLFPQALPFFYMLKAQKCIVGYPGFLRHKTPYYSGNLILKVDPNFKKRVVDVGYPKMANMEELIKLKPNFVVNMLFVKIINHQIEKFNIPVVTTTFGFGDVKEFIKSVQIIGKATNHEKEAKKYISYYESIINYVKSKLKNTKKRPKVLYLSYEGPKGNKLTSGGKFDTLISNIIFLVKGIDVSKNVPGFFGEISTEDILKWNPDYIILAPGFSKKVLYDNPKLKFVNAVKNKKIFIVPFDGKTRYSNWLSPQESSLGILWLAKTIHPNIFKNLNLKKEAQKYYKEFWNLNLNQINLKGDL